MRNQYWIFSFLMLCFAASSVIAEENPNLWGELIRPSDSLLGEGWVRKMELIGTHAGVAAVAALENERNDSLRVRGLVSLQGILWIFPKDAESRSAVRGLAWRWAETESPDVKAAALRVIAEVPDPADSDRLLALVQNSPRQVQERALDALIEINDRRNAVKLKKVIEDLKDDEETGFRTRARAAVNVIDGISDRSSVLNHYSPLRISEKSSSEIEREIVVVSLIYYDYQVQPRQLEQRNLERLQAFGVNSIPMMIKRLRNEDHPLLQESLMSLLAVAVKCVPGGKQYKDDAIVVVERFKNSRFLSVKEGAERVIDYLQQGKESESQ